MSFSIKNCKINIYYSFILILSFALFLGYDDILYLLLFSSLHELGHLLSLTALGGRPKSISLSYYGAALTYNTLLSRPREIAVLSSGFTVNFILYIFLKDNINLMLFVLNILPVYPLDGGRIVRLFSEGLSKILGVIFIILLAVSALYALIAYKSVSLLLIVLYLIVYSLNY